MKYSTLFGKTTRSDISSASGMVSHQLLLRGGFIRESTAGRYFFLPLGWRVHEKIKQIIKKAMDETGAQEMISPVLHPLELWQETNRTNTTGFELMKVKDRRGAEFALGGTAEEMFVDVVRKFNLSYKELPINLYQFSTKFRDEMRARGGLLRVREFVMKDAYSFDRNETEFKQTYQTMWDTYTKIYQAVGLDTQAVAADGGYIGGEYCHEFQVEHPEGEGHYFVSEDGKYCAHEDIAEFSLDEKNLADEMKPYQVVDAVRGKTMEDGAKFHNLPMWQQLKDVMFQDESGNLILAIIRGDLEVNEVKLLKLLKVARIEPATIEQVLALGTVPGFISPVGLKGKVKIVADKSIRTVKNFYGGANAKHKDALNMNIDRDFTVDLEGDIAKAFDGAISQSGSKLLEKRGIEVGNIFQLGYHYTNLMKDSVFTETDGSLQKYYMGCYGIGLGRTLATVVEIHHDDKGIIWPEAIAPFQVHLIDISSSNPEAQNLSNDVYHRLLSLGIDVLWDDRNVSPGVKFADADLIGIPHRLVISPRNGDKIEYKRRSETNSQLLSIEEIVRLITN